MNSVKKFSKLIILSFLHMFQVEIQEILGSPKVRLSNLIPAEDDLNDKVTQPHTLLRVFIQTYLED